MCSRFFASTGAVVVVGLLLAPLPAAAQTAAASPANATGNAVVAKTPWGDPDLQGVYTFSTQTPLQRPATLAGKLALTEAELAEQEELDADNRVNEDRDPRPGDTGTYNAFWTSNEKGRRTGKTSLITDPADGRIPALTARGQKERDELIAEAATRRVGTPGFEYVLYKKPADLPTYTRCVSRPFPRLGQSYNHGIQIVQSPGYVVILFESMHNARIIPIGDMPHLPDNVRLWDGDARGRWEGNTLVIDWTNFDPRQEFQGNLQGNMRFTERLTRVDENTINQEVTVHDPTTWSKPWTYVLPWRADDPNFQEPEDMYEFACHEGNYRQMENALSGSRVIEQVAKPLAPGEGRQGGGRAE
jgi:hypothetical protein